MRLTDGVLGLTMVALSGALAACGNTDGGGSGSGGTGGAGGIAGTSGSAGSGPATGGDNSGGSNSSGSDSGGGDSGGSGGDATGGSPSGGSGGGGSGGGAGSDEAAQCEGDDDCTVHGDCCGCWSLADGESLVECPLDCEFSYCDSFEAAPAARCVFGRCTLDVSCDAAVVTCRQAAPECGEGMTPSVNGMCWGPCVEATECADVTHCSSCNLPAQACLYELGVVGRAHCVEVPSACNDVPGCDCMEEFCGDSQPCTSTDTGISCGGG